MLRLCMCLLLAAPGFAADVLFYLTARLRPAERAVVTIFAVSSPFTASTLSDDNGHFQFKKLRPGPYTVSIYIPDRGEARKTIEIGPGSADSHGHIDLDIGFQDADFSLGDALRRRHSVSTAQLAISAKAQRDYEQAHRDLEHHDAASATRRLEEAVALAPQFVAAWNEIGTMAYQAKNYARAEECFRAALEHDPEAYEPLVNLGGVLVTVNRPEEAWEYNARAVAVRPNDALAHSQMGLNEYELGDMDRAARELEHARAIDPSHFSHPQLLLAEIYRRRGKTKPQPRRSISF